MNAVTTQDLLSASLLTEASPEGRVELSAVVETVGGGGQQLSRQVEVAIVVEKLDELIEQRES